MWRLGKSDSSAVAPRTKLETSLAPVYSSPAIRRLDISGWTGSHTSPLDGSGGYAVVRRSVQFELCRPPTNGTAFELRFEVDSLFGPVGGLRLDLNGHRAFLRVDVVPAMDRSRMHKASAISGRATLRLPIPSGIVGTANTLTVEHVTLGPEVEEEERLGARRGRWPWGLLYRSVALLKVGADACAREPLHLTSLPLWRREGEHTRQVILVEANLPQNIHEAMLTLTAVGTQDVVSLKREPGQFGALYARAHLNLQAEDDCIHARLVAEGRTITSAHRVKRWRRWTLQILPHIHLDIGYTTHPAEALAIHQHNLTTAVGLAEQNPDFRFWVEGSVILNRVLEQADPVLATKILAAMERGQLYVSPFFATPHAAASSSEELLRSLDWSEGPGRRHAGELRAATMVDVPSYTGSLPGILRAAGIDAFLGVKNHFRSATEDADALLLHSPLVWEGVDGAEVLAHFSDSTAQLLKLAGDPPTVAGAEEGFCRFLSLFDRPDYALDVLPIVGTQNDNEVLSGSFTDFLARWNRTYAWPMVTLGTPDTYFEAVAPHRARLPHFRGDSGAPWESGFGSDPGVTTCYRSAQRNAEIAECLAALAELAFPTHAASRQALHALWEVLHLAAEHTWSSIASGDSPDSAEVKAQEEWKRQKAAEAALRALEQVQAGLCSLGLLTGIDQNSLLVVNSLGWARDIEVEIELPFPARFFDDSGDVVDPVRSRRGRAVSHRFLVQNLPAFGILIFRIEDCGTQLRPSRARSGKSTQEIVSERFVVRFDRDGTISSLLERQTGRSLLTDDPMLAFGELVHRFTAVDVYPTQRQGRFSAQDSDPEASEAPWESRSHRARRVAVETGTRGLTLRLAASGESPTLEMAIRLDDRSTAVNVDATMTKPPSRRMEDLLLAFPLADSGGPLWLDRQLRWVSPKDDSLPGAWHQWHFVEHAAWLLGTDGSVLYCPRDAPLIRRSLPGPESWTGEECADRPAILSWLYNNRWPKNFPTQWSGILRSRYRIKFLEGHDPLDALRAAVESHVPGLAFHPSAPFASDDRGHRAHYPMGPLVSLQASDNLLCSFGSDPHPSTLILRVVEIGGSSGQLLCDLPPRFHLSGVTTGDDFRPVVNVHETDASIRLSVGMPPWCRATFQLKS
jgi:hypothetical protein